ncbi:MAG: ATP synthase F1 subunit delta [Candidatus Beckwithbacteria bacterium]|nr:ATP synthase F1 subunit delta [Patescibacteria group bacterium]
MRAKVQVNAIVKGFLSYLTEKKSIDLLPEIAEELVKQSWVRVDPNLATIKSSIKLSKNQISQIKSALKKHFNRSIWIKQQLDKSIIGGFKINIAGQTIDATINKKLEGLKNQVIYE